MEITKLKAANELNSKIEALLEYRKQFSGSSFVNLQVQDHYGNKSHLIEMSVLQPLFNAALSTCDSKIRGYYDQFLKLSTQAVTDRIAQLQKELDEL